MWVRLTQGVSACEIGSWIVHVVWGDKQLFCEFSMNNARFACLIIQHAQTLKGWHREFLSMTACRRKAGLHSVRKYKLPLMTSINLLWDLKWSTLCFSFSFCACHFIAHSYKLVVIRDVCWQLNQCISTADFFSLPLLFHFHFALNQLFPSFLLMKACL